MTFQNFKYILSVLIFASIWMRFAQLLFHLSLSRLLVTHKLLYRLSCLSLSINRNWPTLHTHETFIEHPPDLHHWHKHLSIFYTCLIF